MRHVGSYFPNQGSNPCTLCWKCGVLTTGPPGKSQKCFLFKNLKSRARQQTLARVGEDVEELSDAAGVGVDPAAVGSCLALSIGAEHVHFL